MNQLNIERRPFFMIFSAMAIGAMSIMAGCSGESALQDAARGAKAAGPALQGPEEAIAVGDQVQLSVLGYSEFTTTATVKPSGTIVIPLIGEVKAAGSMKDQLQSEIVRRLSDYVKTRVVVTLSVTSSAVQSIIILGAVTQQSSFPHSSPVSVFQILANAGGPSGDADLAHIKLFRNGDLSREEEIDLSAVVSHGVRSVRGTPMINPGDLVVVPKTENFLKEFSPFAYNIVVVLTLFSLVK